MKNALIIGASGGIGRAMGILLETRNVSVTQLSRSHDGLDITDEDSIAAHLGALTGPFDFIFVATGALVIDGQGPEKSLKQLSSQALQSQFAVNATGPAIMLKHMQLLLPRDCRAVVAILSARVGSITDNALGGWYSYRAAKAALNQIVHTAAIEIARTHKQAIVTALHPGTVATPFTSRFVKPENATPAHQAAENLLATINGLTLDQTGGFLDYAAKPIPW